ncbi:MAG: hypothetical protein ABI585_13810 [Betaproteobacteria bacterium]
MGNLTALAYLGVWIGLPIVCYLVPPILVLVSRRGPFVRRLTFATLCFGIGVALFAVSQLGPFIIPTGLATNVRVAIALGLFVASLVLPWIVYLWFRGRTPNPA